MCVWPLPDRRRRRGKERTAQSHSSIGTSEVTDVACASSFSLPPSLPSLVFFPSAPSVSFCQLKLPSRSLALLGLAQFLSPPSHGSHPQVSAHDPPKSVSS